MFTIILCLLFNFARILVALPSGLFWNTILKTTFSWFTLERINVQPNNDYQQIRLFNALRLVYVKGMCDQYCPSFSVTDGRTDRQRFAFINIDKISDLCPADSFSYIGATDCTGARLYDHQLRSPCAVCNGWTLQFDKLIVDWPQNTKVNQFIHSIWNTKVP